MRDDVETWGKDESGFFAAYKSGKNLIDAYRAALPKLTLPKDAREELEGLFCDFGRCYMQEEIAKLDSSISSLEGIAARVKAQSDVSARLFKTMIFAVALGIIILLL